MKSGPDLGRKLRLLYVVEGYTDIRFVTGLAGFSELTMLVPEKQFLESGLGERIEQAGVPVTVLRTGGGRLTFQIRSLVRLCRIAARFDVILSQEMLRGSLNANIAGRLRGVPVVTYTAMPPIEYFRCRLRRGRIGHLRALAGELLIRLLMTINGHLSARSLALGPYLHEIVETYSQRVGPNHYYGVDTDTFRPATSSEKLELRRKHGLPVDQPLVFLASRISHEKDPETALAACAILRREGIDLVLLNSSGGWKEFQALARREAGPETDSWVLARPAAHPVHEVADYFRAADVTVQASLEEGLGLSPLESLACETPVVATRVGGMARVLPPFAVLVPPRDPRSLAAGIRRALEKSADDVAMTRAGREFVSSQWSSELAFSELEKILSAVTIRR